MASNSVYSIDKMLVAHSGVDCRLVDLTDTRTRLSIAYRATWPGDSYP